MLIGVIKSGWKETHYRRIWKYEKLGEIGKVAEEEGVSLQAISKMLRNAKYPQVREAEKVVLEMLTDQT